MKYLLLILSSILLINCRPVRQVNNLEYCASKFDFGEVNNKIPISELDSIILSEKLTYLRDYKSCNSIERKALKLIKDTIEIMGFKTNEFIIKKVNIHNDQFQWIFSKGIFDIQDSITAFHLNHIDGYVYSHNLRKLNSEYKKNPLPNGWVRRLIGITGNFSGHDGVYAYNQNSNKIKLFKHQ